jgi:hypothetical protein
LKLNNFSILSLNSRREESVLAGLINWIERGISCFDNPLGILIAGIPARFAGMVQRSDIYISNGFSVFSPNLNAGVGVVGDIR